MSDKIHYLNAETEAQMKKAAESTIQPHDAIGWAELTKICKALETLKACDPASLARLEMVDEHGLPLKAETVLDRVRTEMAWVKQRVHGERMKIIRGQK